MTKQDKAIGSIIFVFLAALLSVELVVKNHKARNPMALQKVEDRPRFPYVELEPSILHQIDREEKHREHQLRAFLNDKP